MTTPDISVTGWLSARVAHSGSRPALTFEGRTVTYAELLHRVDRLAAALRANGLRQGDRIAYVGLNHSALLETFLAAARLGAIFVPLNFRLTGPELLWLADDAGLHTVVADADRRAVIDTVRDAFPARRYIGVEDAGPGWQDYDALVENHDPLELPTPVAAEDLALIMYTSGTTGNPKGVMLTHGNLWWNLTNLRHFYDVLGDDVTLIASPLFHIAGLNVTIPTTWQVGGEVILHRSFDPAQCLHDIVDRGVTTLFGAPTMFQMMAALPEFDEADLTRVRIAICGGAPVPDALIEAYQARGIGMVNGYGLTETSPSAAFLTLEHVLTKTGSVGRAPIYSQVKILGPAGEELGPGTTGEITVRGPNVTSGYWNNPEATRQAIDDGGWFRTGDIGYLDDDGFVYLVDRKKDVIVSGGENVASAEVENVLFGHPGVSEVAVIGTPDEMWGELVTAVVVSSGPAPSLEELRDYAGQSLARFKLPRLMHVVDELPRNPSGKILKVALRKQFNPEGVES